MDFKIRSFEKTESKRASSQKKINNINLDSSQQEVDKFLMERYGYGIWNFIYSLYWIVALYSLRNIGKEINLLKTKVQRLKSAKTRLIENIDQFLINTDIWEMLKKSDPYLNIKWTAVKREKFIGSNFDINKFFKIVDEYIERKNKRIKFLKIYSRIPGKKLRISPRNFIIIVWSHVMLTEGNEENIDFENIGVLLNWFSENKNWTGFFESTKKVSLKTPELTYNKYIKFAKDEEYHSASCCLYIDCFPDIADPLIEMFPNPFDLLKQEIGGKKIMAKNEFEKAIKKPLF